MRLLALQTDKGKLKKQFIAEGEEELLHDKAKDEIRDEGKT